MPFAIVLKAGPGLTFKYIFASVRRSFYSIMNAKSIWKVGVSFRLKSGYLSGNTSETLK